MSPILSISTTATLLCCFMLLIGLTWCLRGFLSGFILAHQLTFSLQSCQRGTLFLTYFYCWHYCRCPCSPLLCPSPLLSVFMGYTYYVLWLTSLPSFIQCLPPSTLHYDICQFVPCIHASGSILILSLFWPLDSTCECDRTLAYFT